ncbi:MAG: fumarate hydratase [Clostridiales bacterium]|nr:fumarate hydratase [Clostridiales bacterium]
MKEIQANTIIMPLAQEIKHALMHVDETACALLKNANNRETSPLCRWALEQILENDRIAAESNAYACQDCGQAVLFVSVGQDLHVAGDLKAALNEAVKIGYTDARKSVADPLTRINTKTNTPAILHFDIVPGDKLTVQYLAKGAGSENMGRVYMLTPSKGRQGIIDAVLDCVTRAGSSPCPPIFLGVGIGGTMEKCAVLSKKALLREVGTPRENPEIAALEAEILQKVNETGIGAQGFGGSVTALSCAIETAPTHIGMLPVAITVQCHSDRRCTLEF